MRALYAMLGSDYRQESNVFRSRTTNHTEVVNHHPGLSRSEGYPSYLSGQRNSSESDLNRRPGNIGIHLCDASFTCGVRESWVVNCVINSKKEISVRVARAMLVNRIIVWRVRFEETVARGSCIVKGDEAFKVRAALPAPSCGVNVVGGVRVRVVGCSGVNVRTRGGGMLVFRVGYTVSVSRGVVHPMTVLFVNTVLIREHITTCITKTHGKTTD